MMRQVVLRPGPDHTSVLHIDAPTATQSGEQRLQDGLHLGSQDLIRVAGYAVRHKFIVTSFIVADSDLTPLEPDELAAVSDEMVEILSAYDDFELNSAMRQEFDGLYVIGLELRSLSSGHRISIRRRGYVESAVVDEAESLLQSAWRELELS